MIKKYCLILLVAHGKNTGEEFARKFSNTESSLQSSLGFYITESTYNGSNGFSLKLHGMDKGFNDRALQRAIVMHGADYVSEDFIKSQRRIGRSWGCPAVPTALAKPIINTIKDKNVIFIYYPDQNYLSIFSVAKCLVIDIKEKGFQNFEILFFICLKINIKSYIKICRHNGRINHSSVKIISERILCIYNRIFLLSFQLGFPHRDTL